MQALSRATSAITKQYGLLLRSSNKENHCATFILPALIKFYSPKAKSIISHENDNSCHIKFLTVLMACNVYAPRTYFLTLYSWMYIAYLAKYFQCATLCHQCRYVGVRLLRFAFAVLNALSPT